MKILLSIVIAFFLMASADGQVKWSIIGGPQISSAMYKVTDSKQPNSYKFGFMLGAGLKVPVEETIFFVPQLYYSMKGYKVQLNQSLYPPDPTATSNDTRIHTVETAFLLQFDFNPESGQFFFRTGPSLDFQISGKEKFVTPAGTTNRPMKYGYADYGRYAANWLLHFGYESQNGFMIYGQYSFGLTNISNVDEGPKIRHLAAGITFGKFLGRSK